MAIESMEQLRTAIRAKLNKDGCPACKGSGYATIAIAGTPRREPCPNECASPVVFRRKKE